MISEPQFRRDFPEFTAEADYPPQQVNMWLAMARNLVLAPPWDDTPGLVGIPLPIASLSWTGNLVTLNTPSPHGLVGGFPLTVAGVVPAAYNGTFYATVASASSLQFPLPLAADPGAASTPGTYQQATNSVLDMGTELFAAHMLTLQKRAIDAAAAGKTPGREVGALSNKSLGPGSMGFDVGAGTSQGAAFWNLSDYGTRFYFFCDLIGAGPIQIGVGFDPMGGMNGFNGPAWPGPWPWPSQTGFG